MIIPDGMSEEQVIISIQKVAGRLAPRYTFGYYDVEDIRQEAIIIGMKVIDKYDGIRPLDNFLSISIGNGLKNFKRQMFYRLEKTCSYCLNADPICKYCAKRDANNSVKKFLMEPLDIANIDSENEGNMKCSSNLLNEIEIAELVRLVDATLPMEFRADYLRMKSGVNLPKQRKLEVEEAVRRILEEYK